MQQANEIYQSILSILLPSPFSNMSLYCPKSRMGFVLGDNCGQWMRLKGCSPPEGGRWNFQVITNSEHHKALTQLHSISPFNFKLQNDILLPPRNVSSQSTNALELTGCKYTLCT